MQINVGKIYIMANGWLSFPLQKKVMDGNTLYQSNTLIFDEYGKNLAGYPQADLICEVDYTLVQVLLKYLDVSGLHIIEHFKETHMEGSVVNWFGGRNHTIMNQAIERLYQNNDLFLKRFYTLAQRVQTSDISQNKDTLNDISAHFLKVYLPADNNG